MATFFGEVLDVASRAFDADDDEDDDEKITPPSSPVLRWSPEIRNEIKQSEDSVLNCSLLLLAIGPAPTGFVQSYVLREDYEHIGVIVSGLRTKDSNSFQQTLHTDKTCFVYRLKRRPDIVICQCNARVSADQAFHWTEKLFSSIKKSCVVILASSQVTEYKALEQNQTIPFIKCLCSSVFTEKPVCAYLPQPNTVSELPSAVLNFCQVHSIPSVLYMAYLDSAHLDIASMKVFLPVLDNVLLKEVSKVNGKADNSLKKLVELNTAQNPLYI
ncbi:proteasome assembly chaperone 1-like [Glandiceps talaboti]